MFLRIFKRFYIFDRMNFSRYSVSRYFVTRYFTWCVHVTSSNSVLSSSGIRATKFISKWRMIIAVNFQFKQLERRSLKRSRLHRDSNPWPPRYRCDALPTELWSHTFWARSIYWVHFSREEWNDVKYIWNDSYIWTAVVDQSEEWSSQ